MRARTNQPVTVRYQLANSDGVPTDADSGVTVTVTGSDGTDIVTDDSTTDVGEGEYEYALAPQSDADLLTCTWTSALGGQTVTETTELELVESRLTRPREVRAALSDEQAEWNGPGIEPRVVTSVAQHVEDWFAHALGYPPFVRASRITFRVPSARRLVRLPGIAKPLEILSISNTLDMVPDLADLELDGDAMRTTGTRFYRDLYTVHLRHGLDRIPMDLRQAALRFAEYVVDENNLPSRASTVATPDGGVISLALPGPDRPTGIPDVDGVVARYAIPAILA